MIPLELARDFLRLGATGFGGRGLLNTGEATYSMFALAERHSTATKDPALIARLIEEATYRAIADSMRSTSGQSSRGVKRWKRLAPGSRPSSS